MQHATAWIERRPVAGEGHPSSVLLRIFSMEGRGGDVQLIISQPTQNQGHHQQIQTARRSRPNHDLCTPKIAIRHPYRAYRAYFSIAENHSRN